MNKVREFRQRAGLTQEALARKAGLTAEGLRQVEKGRRANPRLSTAAAIAEALGVSIEEIWPADTSRNVAKAAVVR